MRTMNSRKLGILLFAGLMAGGTAAMADGVPFADWDDWKTVRSFAAPGGYTAATIFPQVMPYDSTLVVFDVMSDNGGTDWTANTTLSGWQNPADPNNLITAIGNG